MLVERRGDAGQQACRHGTGRSPFESQQRYSAGVVAALMSTRRLAGLKAAGLSRSSSKVTGTGWMPSLTWKVWPSRTTSSPRPGTTIRVAASLTAEAMLSYGLAGVPLPSTTARGLVVGLVDEDRLRAALEPELEHAARHAVGISVEGRTLRRRPAPMPRPARSSSSVGNRHPSARRRRNPECSDRSPRCRHCSRRCSTCPPAAAPRGTSPCCSSRRSWPTRCRRRRTVSGRCSGSCSWRFRCATVSALNVPAAGKIELVQVDVGGVGRIDAVQVHHVPIGRGTPSSASRRP